MKPLQMMKQAREVRKIQKQLTKKTVEAASPDGSVNVQARGDMTIKRITLNVDGLDPAAADRLARTIASTVNSALDSSKKAAAEDMSKLTAGLGLPGAGA